MIRALGAHACPDCKCARKLAVGQRYSDGDGVTYIVARFDADSYALIDVVSGDRWSDRTTLEELANDVRSDLFLMRSKGI